MSRRVVDLAASFCVLASVASTQELEPPFVQQSEGGTLPLIGDTPLLPLETFAGHVDVFVDVIPYDFWVEGGTFTVSGIPVGATILRAWLQVTSFDDVLGNPVSMTFSGHALGPQVPDVEDPDDIGMGSFPDLVCTLYRFDVTAFVTGDGAYPYFPVGHSNVYGDSLIVVYEHESLPLRTIAINDGAESLEESTTTSTFDGLPAATARLILFTEADNPSQPEIVLLNDEVVAGPADLFASNEGDHASLVSLDVTTLPGTNTVAVTTQDDWFGLHLAILCIDAVTECFLVIGDAPGDATFLQIGHLFQTQVDVVEESHPVLLDDIPEFVLPGAVSSGRRALPPAGGPSLGGVGAAAGPLAGSGTPSWMADGQFVVQVVMWNPATFPSLPEQYTAGLAVTVLPGGALSTTPYGTSMGSLEIGCELGTNAAGQAVVRFPFSIPGF